MKMERTLDLISKAESSGDPNAVYSGIPARLRPGKPITEMSVGSVLKWQRSVRPEVASTACGEFQFIYVTLNDLVKAGEIEQGMAFDETAQRLGALALMDRRGLEKCVSGRMSVEDFALNLAKEWASLPVPRDIERRGRTVKAGQSYYAGDGLNKSLVSPREVLDAISADLGLAAARPASLGAKVGASMVEFAQRQLSALGYDLGAADGIVGPNTRRAVASFRIDNGLDPSDALDDSFWDALDKGQSKPVEESRKAATVKDLRGERIDHDQAGGRDQGVRPRIGGPRGLRRHLGRSGGFGGHAVRAPPASDRVRGRQGLDSRGGSGTGGGLRGLADRQGPRRGPPAGPQAFEIAMIGLIASPLGRYALVGVALLAGIALWTQHIKAGERARIAVAAAEKTAALSAQIDEERDKLNAKYYMSERARERDRQEFDEWRESRESDGACVLDGDFLRRLQRPSED